MCNDLPRSPSFRCSLSTTSFSSSPSLSCWLFFSFTFTLRGTLPTALGTHVAFFDSTKWCVHENSPRNHRFSVYNCRKMYAYTERTTFSARSAGQRTNLYACVCTFGRTPPNYIPRTFENVGDCDLRRETAVVVAGFCEISDSPRSRVRGLFHLLSPILFYRECNEGCRQD